MYYGKNDDIKKNFPLKHRIQSEKYFYVNERKIKEA